MIHSISGSPRARLVCDQSRKRAVHGGWARAPAAIVEPVALDVSLNLVRAIGIEDNLARPTSLVIDKEGIVRFAYVGKTIADRPSADDLLREVQRIVE